MLGGLVSFDAGKSTEICREPYWTGTEDCSVDTASAPFEKVLSVSGSVVY